MALFNWICTCIFFLLVSVIHIQAQSKYCYVDNTRPIVEENNPPGLVVVNITKAPDVTVRIDSTFQDHDWFEINGTQLILKKSVDYENNSVLIVNLQCLKGGMEIADLLITVQIENLNDNPPVFKETNITVNVNEDTKVSTTIVPQANVTATDADGDVISYSLTGRPPEAIDYFNIQGINNPQISLLKVLDYEKINFAELILYAMDGKANESGTHTAFATINIHIIPADLRPPWFQPCTFTAGGKLCINLGYTGKVNISENATEPLILQPGPLYAIDGDKYLNEKIVYDLVEGNDNDTFSINNITGNITMNKPVNILKTFMLHVMASQFNNPFKYSQTTVQIKVVYKNDYEPYFEKTNYTGTVSVGLPVPSPVMESGTLSTPLKIFAVDKDFADEINPNIEYKIQNSTDFSVTADGFLLTAKVLNLASTITLLAIAYDKEALQEASTLIIIDVTPLTSTTILPTTVTTTSMAPTTTTTTTTTAAPVTSGLGTTISKPSSTHLPPGTTSSLPTVPPGSTKSTTPPDSTSSNAGITGITGKPVTSTKPGSNTPPFVTTVKPPIITSNASSQTTNSLVTGISQTTAGTVKSTIQTPSQSGATKHSTTVISTIRTISPTSSSTETTKPSLPSVSSATDGTGQATATTSQYGTTKPPIPGIKTTAVQSTTPMSSQSKTTKPPTAQATSASSGTTQSTNPISKPTAEGITPIITPTSSKVSRPSTQKTTIPLATESHRPSEPIITPISSKVTRPSTQKTTILLATESHRPSEPETSQVSPTSLTAGVCNMYRAEDMAALGATLGCLLAISLVLLGMISYKHYIQPMKHKHGEYDVKSIDGFTNYNYQTDEKPNPDEKDDTSQASVVSENDDNIVTQEQQGTPPPAEKAVESSQASAAPDALEEGEENDEETDNEKEVRSILTKDRKVADDGYKAVWFKEDIDPEAKDDVVMIEEDSDVERNRDGSDGDNEDGDRDDDVRESDDSNEGDNNDNDHGQGSSDVSFIPGRAWISRSDLTASQSHEDTEERDIFL
ncbi:cadherin-related family member 5 [Tiliqua scincoides]|uniref:cadherin-related family member 5 n=1 Tax=Tiliqua scincoides TaxID=71010 RepID=UPI003462146A